MSKIMTKYNLNVVEYDVTGYYYPKYSTQQIVIAENLEDAKKKAIERTPLKKSGSDWQQTVKVLSAEDIIITED